MATTPNVSGQTQVVRPQMDRIQIGSAWKKIVTIKGKQVEIFTITIDKPYAKRPEPIVLNGIGSECQFQLWSNDFKKEGTKQPDYKFHILIPKK